MTPASTSTPYLDSVTLLRLVDWRIVADLAYSGDGPRPTRMSLVDPTRDSGQFVTLHTMAASGQLEASLIAGGKYQVSDLTKLNLTLAGGVWLRRICGALTHWSMAWSREPGAADPDQVPGAKAALELLEKLRNGEQILPFIEAAGAGGGPQATTLGRSEVVESNNRYFAGLRGRGAW